MWLDYCNFRAVFLLQLYFTLNNKVCNQNLQHLKMQGRKTKIDFNYFTKAKRLYFGSSPGRKGKN